MLATPDVGSSMVLLGYLGVLAVMIGVLASLGGRHLFRAGRQTSEDGLRQTAVRRISWGAAVLALGVAMTAVGLVLLVLVALVLAQ